MEDVSADRSKPEFYTKKTGPIDPSVSNVLGSFPYRDYEIIMTDDPRWVGTKDEMGFPIKTGFVVRGEFGEFVLPVTQQWFFTPYDAMAAIIIMDSLPELRQNGQWPTSAVYEYNKQWAMRRNFVRVYLEIEKIRRLCRDSVSLDENPRDEVLAILDHLMTESWSFKL